MSTAVAEAYGFPGSGKTTSGGEREVVLSVGGRRRKSSDGFFVIEVDEQRAEVLVTENSSVGAPSPSGSSIGENSSSESGGDEEEGEEVESELIKEGDGIGCLDAFEDSLPIKSGLSSFYSGKSKSFTSLAEATSTAKELAKPENPFNKRRRVLANWSRRASCNSLAAAAYLPPLLAPVHAVAEGDEEEEEDSDDDCEDSRLPHRGKNGSHAPALPLPPPRLGDHTQTMGLARRKSHHHGSFRSPRSFSLSDFQNSRGHWHL